MTPVIRFQTLGGMALTDPTGREARAVLAQPKRLALLAYLALANSTGFRRRDTIVAQFWPDLDDAHARGALRQALSFLRRALGDRVIVTRGEEEIGVDRELLWCDATAFAAACGVGRTAEALELYHGHLLDGLFVSDAAPEFERWLDEERATLCRLAVGAAWREAERCRAAGDRVGALVLARRAAALAPDDEATQARLIALLDEAGDRAGALEVYDQFTRRLRREYEVDPAPETQGLIERIRARVSPPVAAEPEPLGAAVVRQEQQRPAVAPKPGARRNRGLSYGAVVAVLAVAAAVAGPGRGRNVAPAALTIAVIPPGAGEQDTALVRMGRDLSITLSATLDGVGGIRTVDPSTILANPRGTQEPRYTRAAAAALGRKLGAGSVVHGQLSRAGAGVRVELGLFTTDSLRQLAAASVTVGEGDLNAVSDSVSWIMLRQLWRRGPPPTPSLAAVTTHSVPALRAFLEGEQAVVQNRWGTAEEAYREAVRIDPAFALAEFRYALAQFWQEEEIDSATLAHLAERRLAVSERDRLLIDAWLAMADSATLTLQLYGETTRRFPDYWPGWLLYGDWLYHFGPMVGVDMQEAVGALGQAAALNPGLVPAWHHLILAAAAHDPAAAAQARERLARLGWLSEPATGAQAFERMMLDLLATLSAGEASHRTGLMDSLARVVAALPEGDVTASMAPIHLLVSGFPEAQIDFNGRVLRHRISAMAVARQLRGLAWAWAARGAWDLAARTMDQAVVADPTSRSAEDRYALATTAAWVGAADVVEAGRAGQAAREAVDRAPADRRRFALSRLVWLDGVAAFLRRDPGALTRAIAATEKLQGTQDHLIRRSLAAFTQALAGDRAAAATELVALEQYCINRKDCGVEAPNIALQRSAAAEWLLAAGDTATAMRLLGWHEAGQVGWHYSVSMAMGALDYLARARIEETRGAAALARRYYTRFLQRYDRPVAAHGRLVQEARVALARVSAVEGVRGVTGLEGGPPPQDTESASGAAPR